MHRKMLVVLAVAGCVHAAGDAALDRETLRGITAVNVVIDRLDPVLEREGLNVSTLQDRIEQRLQRAGIHMDQNAKEFVGLRITQVRDRRGPYAVCIMIGVYQPVELTRDRKLHTATQTWEVESVLMADPKQLNQATQDTLDDLAGRFVTAFQSVNPATASSSGRGN
ncbi:MAG TPA: hypothetical protein VGF59_22710 [Bryobacteraceae bacterium]|jgi:hypothetical protein